MNIKIFSYKNRIQEILKIYYESGPLNYPIIVKYIFPWLTTHEAREIIECMVSEDLLMPVSKSLGKYKITAKGAFIVRTGGWVTFLQKYGSIEQKHRS
jgi:hypothetical protein